MTDDALSQLAINGGPKAIPEPLSGRFHFGEEEKNAVNLLFDRAITTGNAPGYNGGEEEEYCRLFSEYMGGGFSDGVNSGTNAVYIALRALNIEPFSEVIACCVTDPGGMMPIVLNNCIPVVADSSPGCYNSGPEQIDPLISPLTKAIIVPHIGGEPADIEGILDIASKSDIPVIEDCAQAHGAEINGRKVGTFGKASAFSTMFGKHHCTGGQGGIVFTKDEDLYYRIRRTADRGKPIGLPAGSNNCIASLNFNLNDLAAAIGCVQLKKLPDIIERRIRFVEMLKTKGLSNLESIIIPKLIPGAKHVYWWWRLEVNTEKISCSKDEFCNALIEEGIRLNPSYRGALPHTFTWFKEKNCFGGNGFPWSSPEYKGQHADGNFPCPNAMDVMNRQFNLTISENWGEKEADLIIEAFKKVDAAYAIP